MGLVRLHRQIALPLVELVSDANAPAPRQYSCRLPTRSLPPAAASADDGGDDADVMMADGTVPAPAAAAAAAAAADADSNSGSSDGDSDGDSDTEEEQDDGNDEPGDYGELDSSHDDPGPTRGRRRRLSDE